MTNHYEVMDNLQIRLPEEEIAALDELAGQLKASRSDAARAALDEGMRVIRMNFAFQRYADGAFTLARAAEYAGVSIQRMAQHVRDRGLAYARYEVDEAERDVETAGLVFRKRRA